MTVCAGVAIGPVRLRGYELDRPVPIRIPAGAVDAEVERFRRSVDRSTAQVEAFRTQLAGELGEMEGRILAVHLDYLRDPVFLKDIENRIRAEQLALEDALAHAVRDFGRIFELVESERMKERALDLRDVALRVVRNLEPDGREGTPPPPPADEGPVEPHVLAAQKLSIADLFHLDQKSVLGIIAEEGGLKSHAAILARSMGIPTVTGIRDLRAAFQDGDYVILDAGTGVVHTNPDERLLREYAVRSGERVAQSPGDPSPIELGDGASVSVCGACGNLGEVTQAAEAALDRVAVYRTELLFLIDRTGPGEDLLLHHYREVLQRAGTHSVGFRLLDITRDQRIAGLRPHLDPNPALGLKGVRLLLAEPSLLRLQIRALLRLVPGETIDVLVPFVTSVQDIQRVQEAIRAERAALLKAGVPCVERARLGAIVEVPATAFHVASVASEVDLLVVAIDDLQQYLLAADRDNPQVADYYQVFHPSLFRLLHNLRAEAAEGEKEIVLFGEGASDPLRLPFYLGAGYRSFAISPVRAARVRHVLRAWTQSAAEDLAQRVLAAPSSLEVQRILLASAGEA